MSQLFPSVHYNSLGHAFQIVERNVEKSSHSTYKHRIRFIDTGYETLATTFNIKRGKVKDYMQPCALGVGYMGDDPRNFTYSQREYALWKNMLRRVFDKNAHSSYKNVQISYRWFSFKNFVEDIRSLPGYDKWVLNDGYVLDKDILSTRLGFKLYSPQTCHFITAKENNEAARWHQQLKAAFKKAVDIRTLCNIEQDA